MEMFLPRAATPRCPDGRPDCLSRRQLQGPTPVSQEAAPACERPETAHEARR
jgi:hypothetical protein